MSLPPSMLQYLLPRKRNRRGRAASSLVAPPGRAPVLQHSPQLRPRHQLPSASALAREERAGQAPARGHRQPRDLDAEVAVRGLRDEGDAPLRQRGAEDQQRAAVGQYPGGLREVVADDHPPLLAAREGVQRGLVQHQVETPVLEVHEVGRVAHAEDEPAALPHVADAHLVDDLRRDVDVRDAAVAGVVELLRQQRGAAAHVQDPAVLPAARGPLQDPRDLRQADADPVEGLLVRLVAAVPVLHAVTVAEVLPLLHRLLGVKGQHVLDV
mmetsp:Transcript_98256/g.306552  ORF Transcript_98256/g.306552 Transcript_98256/m.306552 type:complete len:269 (-) Transcript_98256:176-982(-)